jgi:hypothetical protein
VRGVQKHVFSKNIEKNKSGPSPFLASDSPTHHGGPRVFFGGPLPLRQGAAEEKKKPANVRTCFIWPGLNFCTRTMT